MGPIETSKSKSQLPASGTPCITLANITPAEKCGGFLVHQKHIDARQPNRTGLVWGWVPGAGGDIWWVKHEDDSIGAYLYTELTDLP